MEVGYLEKEDRDWLSRLPYCETTCFKEGSFCEWGPNVDCLGFSGRVDEWRVGCECLQFYDVF